MDLAVWQATAPLLGGWKLPDEDLILPVAYGRGFFDGESTIENCWEDNLQVLLILDS